MKVLKEWFVDAPWGKIALISWGNPDGEPVLLVHGRQDSASTFIPLLEHLPEKYHYVGIDLPGNGRSEQFPIGVKLSRFHFVIAVEIVIEHLQWSHFIYIGHSMGCEQGLFYNSAYPGRIKKMIHLDLGPSLQRLQVHDLVEYYNNYYYEYFNNYHVENNETKFYSRRKAMDAVKRARGLTEMQAEIILSRNLIQVGDDLYRLSWDRRLRTLAPQNFPVDYYWKLFSKNAPPTLLLAATEETSNPYFKGKQEAKYIIQKLQKTVKIFKVVNIIGGHDVHLTHPERLSGEIVSFLETDFGELGRIEWFEDQNTEDLKNYTKAKL